MSPIIRHLSQAVKPMVTQVICCPQQGIGSYLRIHANAQRHLQLVHMVQATWYTVGDVTYAQLNRVRGSPSAWTASTAACHSPPPSWPKHCVGACIASQIRRRRPQNGCPAWRLGVPRYRGWTACGVSPRRLPSAHAVSVELSKAERRLSLSAADTYLLRPFQTIKIEWFLPMRDRGAVTTEL